MLFASMSMFAKTPEWIRADWDDDLGWTVYVSTNIQEPSSRYGTTKVWTKWLFHTQKARQEFNTKASKTMELYEYKDNFRQYRIAKSIEYDKNGDIIHESQFPSWWEYIVPESLGELISSTVQNILLKNNRCSQ